VTQSSGSIETAHRRVDRSSVPLSHKSNDSASEMLLEKVIRFVRRFVVLSSAQATIVALWIFHTHALRAAETTPYLAITSAEKQCGKTRLLEVLQLLVANPWFTGRLTAAVLIRKIDADEPTLLLDETDTAFQCDRQYAEALRGLLNSGYRRGGIASCCVGKGAKIDLKDFQTFCPKALAGIGKLPDTVADRSIPIRLKRKAPGDGEVERFRLRLIREEAAKLHQGIVEWVCQQDTLHLATPALPNALSDRQQDGVEPLLAIADAIGDVWPERDIRLIFDQRGTDRLSSQELVLGLTEVETSSWAECNHGRPLSQAGLSRLLRPFEISPRTMRLGDSTFKGYYREFFEDAWKRYLKRGDVAANAPQVNEPSQPSQGNSEAPDLVLSIPSQRHCAIKSKSAPPPESMRVVTDVTVARALQEDTAEGEFIEGEV
jgi:Protein of unknown function (DUF3631)